MHRLTRLTTSLLFILVLLISPGAPVSAQAGERLFAETGKTVRGAFLRYWEDNGGQAAFGLPVANEQEQRSHVDGKLYLIQYFEQVVFEHHPARRAPHDVLLTLLGTARYAEKYPGGAPGQRANGSPGALYFAETGTTLGGRFMEHWQAHGGLARHGYPISDEFQETHDDDGKRYTVQYFERSVFVHHPEKPPPGDVLRVPLGGQRYHMRQREISRTLGTLEQISRRVREHYAYRDLRGLDWNALHEEYTARIRIGAGKDQAYALIAELVGRLDDRHSSFHNPDEVQAYEEPSDPARHADVGANFQDVHGKVRLSHVVPDGPAAGAGLQVLDVILTVDGVRPANAGEAWGQILGAEGTVVTLDVQTPGEKPRQVQVTRELTCCGPYASAHRLPGTNIAFVHLPTFSAEHVAWDVEYELYYLAEDGPLDGLVIDTRLNGGGYIEEELDTLALFVDGGIAGYATWRSGTESLRIEGGMTIEALRGKPIVVLVSELCESACEQFAVAMRDLKRAELIGSRTAGNTEIVSPIDLLDGSRLMLATGLFYRRDNSSIEGKGIAPNIGVYVPWYDYPRATDPQIEAAIRQIKRKR